MVFLHFFESLTRALTRLLAAQLPNRRCFRKSNALNTPIAVKTLLAAFHMRLAKRLMLRPLPEASLLSSRRRISAALRATAAAPWVPPSKDRSSIWSTAWSWVLGRNSLVSCL